MAESFGSDAARYDRARPRYPEALVERIVAASPGPAVLDVGTGTGIAARQFQAAGGRVLGVEPDARMADFARRTGVETEVAKFEDWDDAGREFDAVIAATAWHWVDPVTGAAKAARVLRPGGLLAPFWHVSEPPPEVTRAFVTAFRRAVPGSPLAFRPAPSRALDAYQGLLAKAADGIRAAGEFSDPDQWRYDWEKSYRRDEWLDQLPTSGALSGVPPNGLAEVLEAVGAAIDALGGGIAVQITTVAVVAVRTAPQARG
jgi:SAM-dependent methyltransferase